MARFFFLVAAFACFAPAFGATFNWDPSPDAATPGKITGYKIYYSIQNFTTLPADAATNPLFTVLAVGDQTNAVVQGLSPGQNYYFTVTAVGADGLESDPSNIITYVPPSADTPTVSLASPAHNSVFLSTDVVTLSAVVSGFSVAVSRVEFYDGAALLVSRNAAPYSFSTPFGAGPHSLTAKAFDVKGGVVTSGPVNISVNVPQNNLPSISLTSPASGSSFFTNELVTISAIASDSDGAITKVEFFDDVTLIGSRTAAPYTIALSTLAQGVHSITAKATDDRGAIALSAAASITIKGNQSPAVSLTSPAASASFFTNEVVNLSASASDPDGSVARVEFFDGATLLGSKTSSPYSMSVSTLSQGTHTLTAKVTDDKGATATSVAATITIKINQPPTVALSNPANNASFFTNEIVTISATASDSDGTISKVEFFDGATLLGSKTATPYSMTVSTLSQGSHTITARATDDKNGVATSAASTITIKVNQAPTVLISSPAGNSSFFTNEVVTISATASDTDGTISKVEFFDGAASLGVDTSSPYVLGVSTLAAGAHSISAKATDDKGAMTTSSTTSITIKVNQAPTVALTSPAANATFFTNEVVTLSANASDFDGTIAKVEFFDGATLLGARTESPFTVAVSTLNPGNHSITAKATDDKGASATSSPTSVTIHGNQAPSVALTSPVNGSSFLTNETVSVVATASDPDGSIAKVEFFDGVTLLGTVTQSPFSLAISALAVGSHSITAKATDDRGSVTTSPAATITIKVNQGPTVALTSPAADSTYQTNQTVTISATAGDPDGTVAKVEFYKGTTRIGTKNAAPYSITYSSFGVGTHSLTAKATDNGGTVTTSEAITIVVKNNGSPQVAITSPADGSSFLTNETVTISASASDTDGTVAKVEFFDGATLLGSRTASPYLVSIATLAVGQHVISAKATDDRGAVTTSAGVAVTIKQNQAPTVALTSPANNSSFLTNEVVTLIATASDSDGQIARVDFMDGATLLGSATQSPFTLATSTLSVGNHLFKAQATDDKGAVAASAEIAITIKENQAPTVAITSPANNSSFFTNDVVTFSASAGDPDGSVSKVEFFDGATLLGAVSAPPYTVTSSTLSAGSHAITARATDNRGGTATSPATTLTINVNQAPAVSLTSPAFDASFYTNEVVTISANANDTDGTVARVEFFDGATLLGSKSTAPYSIAVSTLAQGAHSLTAKATDDKGASTSTPATAITIKVNQAPAVSLINPANNSNFFTNEVVTITANATDSDGTVSKVEFFDGATLLAAKTAAPFSMSSTTMAAGIHTLTAKATDDKGAVTTSSPSAVTIKVNQAPTVALTSPANNSTFITNEVVNISASASDPDGSISKVEFFDGAALIGSRTAAPYAIAISTLSAGAHTLTAKATDDRGVITTSAASSITIKANLPPTVALTSPANGAVFGTNDSLTLSANASDSDGAIAMVQFFKGATLLGTKTAAPYSFSAGKMPIGTHTFTANATDDKGAMTVSAPVAISVKKNKPGSGTAAASVPLLAQIVNVVEGSFVSAPVVLQASASGGEGAIVSVEFFAGDLSLGVSTNAPFSITRPLTSGTYNFFVIATDSSGSVAASAPIRATVRPRSPLSLLINNAAVAAQIK